MRGIIDIDVGTWTWVWSFDFLVALSIITAVEGRMRSFLCNDLILDVIFLLLGLVMCGTWNLSKSLSCVRRFTLVLPELSSFSFGQEGLRLLANKLPIRVLLLVFLSRIFNRKCCFVRSWSRIWCLDYRILTVRDL